MEGIAKWALLGLGAYLLYEQYVAPAATTSTSVPSTTPATTSAAIPPAAIAAQQTLNLLEAVGPQAVLVAAQTGGDLPASAEGQLTASQWNWYLAQVTGVNVITNSTGVDFSSLLPAPANTDATATISLSTFWNAVITWATNVVTQALTAAGTTTTGTVSGLSGLGYRDANAYFPQPPAPGAARFDFAEVGW